MAIYMTYAASAGALRKKITVSRLLVLVVACVLALSSCTRRAHFVVDEYGNYVMVDKNDKNKNKKDKNKKDKDKKDKDDKDKGNKTPSGSNSGKKPAILADNDVAKALMEEAYTWIGTPYLWGGNTKNGADCSGFVVMSYKNALSINLPRTSRDQSDYCKKIDKKELEVGDLVFFHNGGETKTINHVGIYVGDDSMIHASSSKGVIISSLSGKYYVDHFHHFAKVEAFRNLVKESKNTKKKSQPKKTKAKDTKQNNTKAKDTKQKDTKQNNAKAKDTKQKDTKAKDSKQNNSKPQNSKKK